MAAFLQQQLFVNMGEICYNSLVCWNKIPLLPKDKLKK